MRAILAILLTASGFLVGSTLVGQAVPFPAEFGMDVRLRAFAEHKDEYDAIYLGPSTVFRAFRPEVIDPLLSTREQPFKSFNLGFGGMFGYESDSLLNKVLAMRPARLRHVIIEPQEYDVDPSMYNVLTERSVHWHDWHGTRRVIRGVWLQPLPRKLQVSLTLAHLKAFLHHQSNYGQWQGILRNLFGEPSQNDVEETRLLLQEGGYQQPDNPYQRMHRGLPPDLVRRHPDRRQFADELQKHMRKVSRENKEFSPDAYDVQAFQETQRTVEKAGMRVTYVLTPFPRGYLVGLRRFGLIDECIDLCNIAEHPVLYRAENRIDLPHLNLEGARMFSELFAQRFRKMLLAVP